MKLKIKKESIFYYKKNGKECEVIIDTKMINIENIEVIEEGIIKQG
jgi:hypothetical protein